ncbi:AbrB/MazE/SpoVT family DNA-binding domain-containing protein [Deferrisoma sp.]
MRITSKGQVTIPQPIREKPGFLPGTEVEFVVEGNTLRAVKSVKGANLGRRVVETLRGKATSGMTTDEILALTRGDDE